MILKEIIKRRLWNPLLDSDPLHIMPSSSIFISDSQTGRQNVCVLSTFMILMAHTQPSTITERLMTGVYSELLTQFVSQDQPDFSELERQLNFSDIANGEMPELPEISLDKERILLLAKNIRVLQNALIHDCLYKHQEIQRLLGPSFDYKKYRQRADSVGFLVSREYYTSTKGRAREALREGKRLLGFQPLGNIKNPVWLQHTITDTDQIDQCEFLCCTKL